jgi:hypothetical protein
MRAKGKTKQIIFSVKAAIPVSPTVRDLRAVLDREQAEIRRAYHYAGANAAMKAEAASAGFYTSTLYAD